MGPDLIIPQLSFRNTFKFEYDKYGNWINETFFANTVPTGFTTRELNYYNK
jgi:hypothetical protein